MRIRSFLLCAALSFLSGCGTVVPKVGEPWDDNSGISPNDLELLIKKKIYCELQQAIEHQNGQEGFKETLPNGQIVFTKRVPESWGVQLTLQFVVIENSIANPSATFVPGAPTFSLATGATLSSEATRTDKFISYYLVRDLQREHAQCEPRADGSPGPRDARGSSLLLNSDLGIERWLNNAMNVRAAGVSMDVQQAVASYDVKFQVVTSGSISPLWKLERVSTGTVGGSLFSTKRDRTHELILTFGPTKEGEAPASPGRQRTAQPSTIAANSALAQEIGAAVGVAVRNALAP
ncbi:hypothetical protein [Methylorubrum populi]